MQIKIDYTFVERESERITRRGGGERIRVVFQSNRFHYHMLPDIRVPSNGCITRKGIIHRSSHEREQVPPHSFHLPPAALASAPAEFHRRHVPLWFMRLAVAKRRISPSSHFCFRWNMCSIRRNYLYAILPILFITHVIYSVLFGTQGFLDIGYGVNSFSLGF